MAQRFFFVDLNKCFGCYGCVAACSNANGTPEGVFWRSLHKLPPESGSSALRWLSLACNHCENPPCVAACPSKALIKREEDGVVLHLEDRCLGCRYCQMACPYDAISWDAKAGMISKCHFCHERLEAGREPACVETCFAGAISQRVVEDDESIELSREVPGFSPGSGINPSIRFVTGEEKQVFRRENSFPPTILKVETSGD